MKYDFKTKAIISFENALKKPFELKTLTDLYVYFFCVRDTNIENYSQSFDDFLTECDNDPKIFEDFMQQYIEYNKKQNVRIKKNVRV